MTAGRQSGSTLQRWRGLTALGGDAYARAGTQIQRFHQAIARQPFAVLGAVPGLKQAVAPIKVLHDGITDAVYLGVREIGGLVFETVGDGLAALDTASSAAAPATPPRAQPRFDAIASALSGAFGDHLITRRNPLAPRAGFYVDGLRVPLQRDALREAYTPARRKLAVFVHGLCCNETSWQLFCDRSRAETLPYGERLTAAGYSALYLRYNSGAHISDNGRRLARLLRQLVAQWPEPVDEIVLIGHSMGGLVIRSALADAMRSAQPWTAAVRHVVCLGTPHQGAALEKLASGAAQWLKAFELSRPWGEALDLRSVGIRDLHHGATSTGDWRDGLQRQWRPAQPIARLPHARYHFIGSSIGVDARDWRGRILGDGLVHLPSALAAELADAHTAAVFGKHHMQLLNDPAVYALLSERLGLAPPTVVSAPMNPQAAAVSG